MLHHGPAQLLEHNVASLTLADGDITMASLRTALGLGSGVGVEDKVLTLGRDSFNLTRVVAEPCSDTLEADSGTKAYRMAAGRWLYGNTDQTRLQKVGASLRLITAGNATIGTATGISGAGPVDNTYRFADTLTTTEDAYHTALKTAMGSAAPQKYSPESNGVAQLIVDELGPYEFVVIQSVTGLLWRATAFV